MQCFALDVCRGFSYYAVIAAAIVTAGCGVPGRLEPGDLPALEMAVVEGWVRQATPTLPLRYELRWTYSTDKGSSRGRAAVHFAPPDSVRFDFRAPFGRSGAAVVMGDSIAWAEPEENVEALVRSSPLFWGLLGVPRPPSPMASVAGQERGGVKVWRYARVTDTLTYRTDEGELGPRLQVELRRGNELVGRVMTLFTRGSPYPFEGTVWFPAGPAVFQLTVQGIDTLAAIDATIWKHP